MGRSNNLLCVYCGEFASWSPLLDHWWCGDCRSDDLIENDEETSSDQSKDG